MTTPIEPAIEKQPGSGEADQMQALLKRSLAVIQQNIDDIGGCDHSVGVCCCDLIHLANDIRDHLIALGWTPPGAQQPTNVDNLWVCAFCRATYRLDALCCDAQREFRAAQPGGSDNG